MKHQLIAQMGKFASTAKNDAVSVAVARVVQKLHSRGMEFSDNLTLEDRKIIALFEKLAA